MKNTRKRRGALLTLLAALPGLGLYALTTGTAEAHGAPMNPGSRTYLCWKHSLSDTGEIKPTNPACQAALDQSGATSFYNWFAVLRSDGAGRTEGYIPDGELCSGGTGGPYDFTGFNLPRTDWPFTHLTAGAEMEFRYNAWAAHPGTFRLYVTEDGYDPSQPLTWADVEDQPFMEVTDPPQEGPVGSEDGYYHWNGRLPQGKEGRHVIYMVWERSDSQETFYSCSDVSFDGGSGEVEVPGQP
ncbi:lytic polysaccharide monooxygenase [Streptomyces sp. SB3404]|uniref:Lytic polysaccharide monooxygenase n=1 Tax=Streptomyces boncukensis TaxID=2711219 RepID=A0A6G4WUH1_9ACTN|nr:lytic polysaccharide monooxygenase [Streptomyces boncukensis]